ncbi:MAG: hypothetical protein RIC18_05145 [Hoeflea sp.]|uniref:hypothetical protein n=1 Tax=Hoeflea sp. TaxID=1940281 RepID=UPI0032EC64BC
MTDNERDKEVNELAKRLHSALEAVSPSAFVGSFMHGKETTLDGYFDLEKVAMILLQRRS